MLSYKLSSVAQLFFPELYLWFRSFFSFSIFFIFFLFRFWFSVESVGDLWNFSLIYWKLFIYFCRNFKRSLNFHGWSPILSLKRLFVLIRKFFRFKQRNAIYSFLKLFLSRILFLASFLPFLVMENLEDIPMPAAEPPPSQQTMDNGK